MRDEELLYAREGICHPGQQPRMPSWRRIARERMQLEGCPTVTQVGP